MSAPTEGKPGTEVATHGREEGKAVTPATTKVIAEALDFEFIEAARPQIKIKPQCGLSCS